MRLVKVPVANLQPGMYVAELDRPWLETPFSLQGFTVRDHDEVFLIGRYVNFVYVDADYRGARTFLPRSGTKKNAGNAGSRLTLKADFAQARARFESASEALDRVFSSIKHKQPTDIATVKRAVAPLIKSVFHNKEAAAALVRLKESNDYRYSHGVSMAVWAAILGRHIGLHSDELEKLVVGCAMCDIGMTELPDEWHEQTTPLTPEQQQAIEKHPVNGSKMVSHSGGDDLEILAIVENHHERFDGSGYPHGLEGAAIPLLGRIAGLVDTYDAMISNRPYAKARSSYEAVQELIDCKGRLFQDSLIEQFVQAIGLFPTGSLVELNTGEVAIVVKQNETRRLKPEVVIVLDSDKQRLSPLKLVDLSDSGASATDSYWITRELAPGSYGLNSEEFFI